MRVLLVDDDPSVLRFLEDLLQARGHVVLSVQPQDGDGVHAAAAAAALRPDLLIVDKQMPIDPAGVTAAAREAAPDVRVILCTGSLTSPEEQARIGADLVLMKPFTPAELDRLLARSGSSAAEGTSST